MQPSNQPMITQWVKGVFTGDQAKYVSGLANEGIGYKILDSPNKGAVIAAFRKPMDRPLPDYLQPITNPHEIKKLEAWRTGE